MSGKQPRLQNTPNDRRASEHGRASAAPEGAHARSERNLYVLLCGIVAALVALVWWSLPGDSRPGDEADVAPRIAAAETNATPSRTFARTTVAVAEFAVLTTQTSDVVKSKATVDEIARKLDVRHCGGACDAVRTFLSTEGRFTLDVRKTEDLILPPKDRMSTVAAGLTSSERDSIDLRTTSVVVRTEGPGAPEQMPARVAFATASVLAEMLDGFVYDEVSRRIETARDFTSRAVLAPVGEPAFERKHIVVQFYRQDDGTARLLSLGMQRFGSPDVSLRAANMSSGSALSSVLNVVASKLAHGESASTITVSLDDVSRLVGKPPAELHPSPDEARAVELTLVHPERIEGDPDNEMVELLPAGGAGRETWDNVLVSLFGLSPSTMTAIDDEELTAIAEQARHELPQAITRFEAGEGDLYIKGPFSVDPSLHEHDTHDAQRASTEMLWIAVATCDARACTGVLSNEPSYATNVTLGTTTSVRRDDVVDWMLHRRDGSTLGGASIEVLKGRMPNATK